MQLQIPSMPHHNMFGATHHMSYCMCSQCCRQTVNLCQHAELTRLVVVSGHLCRLVRRMIIIAIKTRLELVNVRHVLGRNLHPLSCVSFLGDLKTVLHTEVDSSLLSIHMPHDITPCQIREQPQCVYQRFPMADTVSAWTAMVCTCMPSHKRFNTNCSHAHLYGILGNDSHKLAFSSVAC